MARTIVLAVEVQGETDRDAYTTLCETLAAAARQLEAGGVAVSSFVTLDIVAHFHGETTSPRVRAVFDAIAAEDDEDGDIYTAERCPECNEYESECPCVEDAR